MNSPITQNHWVDANGNPAGGCTFGDGFAISWQNGPLGRGEDRKDANGAFVENIIKAAIGRLEFYQASRFNCDENAKALISLTEALAQCNSRTQRRESQSFEGTHAGN